jgi:hypothetical protein
MKHWAPELLGTVNFCGVGLCCVAQATGGDVRTDGDVRTESARQLPAVPRRDRNCMAAVRPPQIGMPRTRLEDSTERVCDDYPIQLFFMELAFQKVRELKV